MYSFNYTDQIAKNKENNNPTQKEQKPRKQVKVFFFLNQIFKEAENDNKNTSVNSIMENPRK